MPWQIYVVSDLPVGENFQDHVGVVGMEFKIEKPYSPLPRDVDSQDSMDWYEKLRSGASVREFDIYSKFISVKFQIKFCKSSDSLVIPFL